MPHVEEKNDVPTASPTIGSMGHSNTIAEIEPTDIHSVTLGVSWECPAIRSGLCAAIV